MTKGRVEAECLCQTGKKGLGRFLELDGAINRMTDVFKDEAARLGALTEGVQVRLNTVDNVQEKLDRQQRTIGSCASDHLLQG